MMNPNSGKHASNVLLKIYKSKSTSNVFHGDNTPRKYILQPNIPEIKISNFKSTSFIKPMMTIDSFALADIDSDNMDECADLGIVRVKQSVNSRH